jgi:hypothetical protein
MKYSTIIPVALLIAGATAQGDAVTLTINGPGTGTTTEYYSLCPESNTGLITVTGTTTQTYCPGPNCHGTPSPTAGPRSGYTTVYTTVYSSFCTSGLAPVIYTITEACPCHGMSRPGYIPQGFTTSVATCTTCGEGTITATLTIPIANPTGGAGGNPVGPYNPGATVNTLVGNLPGSSIQGGPVPGNRYGAPATPTAAAGGSNMTGPTAPAPTAARTAPEVPEYTGAAPAISIEALFLTWVAVTAGTVAWAL